jgi:dCMP deaminase
VERKSKIDYYLDIALTVAQRSTCLRKCYGAIIVKNDEIIATGYNGAPRGRKNCTDLNYCIRESMKIPSGERYELCRSVHSEMNAIISASRESMIGADLYLACFDPKTGEEILNTCSCSMCKRHIINSGIKTVYVRSEGGRYIAYNVEDWITNDDSLTGNTRYMETK